MFDAPHLIVGQVVPPSSAVWVSRDRVLDDVFGRLKAGDWVQLVGPPRSGKTSVLRALQGRTDLRWGEASIDEAEPTLHGVLSALCKTIRHAGGAPRADVSAPDALSVAVDAVADLDARRFVLVIDEVNALRHKDWAVGVLRALEGLHETGRISALLCGYAPVEILGDAAFGKLVHSVELLDFLPPQWPEMSERFARTVPGHLDAVEVVAELVRMANGHAFVAQALTRELAALPPIGTPQERAWRARRAFVEGPLAASLVVHVGDELRALSAEHRIELLDLWLDVLSSRVGAVANRARSDLRWFGLAALGPDGSLLPRSEVIAELFDARWVAEMAR